MMIVLFVINDESGGVFTFSREVPDEKPETLRAALDDGVGDVGLCWHDVCELFIIEGELTSVDYRVLRLDTVDIPMIDPPK